MRWVPHVIQEINRVIDTRLKRRLTETPGGAAPDETLEEDRELRVCLQTLRASIDAMELLAAQVDQQTVRYEQFIEFVPSGYVETDAEGLIQRANEAAARMLRWPPRVLRGKPLVAFVADRDFAELLHRVSSSPSAGESESRCVTLRCHEGEPLRASIWIAVSRAPDGQFAGFRCLMRAIDRR